jgi:hypothetical protein
MWEPLGLTIPWASTACYRDNLNFLLTKEGGLSKGDAENLERWKFDERNH